MRCPDLIHVEIMQQSCTWFSRGVQRRCLELSLLAITLLIFSHSGTTVSPMFSFSQPKQSSSKPSQPSADNDVSMDTQGQDQTSVQTLYLKPEAYPRDGKEKWKATGRTISAAVGPVGGEVAVWVTKKVCYYIAY